MLRRCKVRVFLIKLVETLLQKTKLSAFRIPEWSSEGCFTH